jgi:TonB family protein
MKVIKTILVLLIMLFMAHGMGMAAAEGPLALDEKAERPKLVKRVNPVYPPEAVEQKIQGRILVEAVTSTEGKVIKVDIIPQEPRQPLLEAAALEAVKQWEYEPFLVEGKPKEVKFTVVITFRLNGDAKVEKIAPVERPKLVNRVAPVYPPEALKEKIQGLVKLEVHIDETGAVSQVIPDPEHQADPLLAEAAMAAVRQWRYEPYLKDGKARPAAFKVMVTFRLDSTPPQEKE